MNEVLTTEELLQELKLRASPEKISYGRPLNPSRRKWLEIDFNQLSKYDPELAENLLDKPEETIKAASLASSQIDDIEDRQILFCNLPESTNIPLSEIGDQINKFLSFKGYVMKPSDIFLKCDSARFECPSCGAIITVLMLGREWKEPKKCGCGRKGKFRLLSKHLIKFQRLEIQEAVDMVPDKPRRLIKKKVFIAENLTRKTINQELQPGKMVVINGFLELESLRSKSVKYETNEFRTNIIANNIIPIEHSWESIKLNKTETKKIVEMAKKKSLLEEFSQSLAPSFEGYEIIRKSLILQHVAGKRILDESGNLEERGTIHILLSGSPGTGKSYLLRKSLVISPLWNWTIGKGLTKVGLVACVVRDEYGSYVLEIGPLVMSDNGICGIDEMNAMNPNDFGMLNNAMNDEQTKITKANIDQMLKTRTSILATSNPIHKVFTDHESIIKQLAPIPKDILDRFDVIWPMREIIDQDKLEDKYMARHLKSENVKQIWSNEEMRNYISYARRLTPIIPLSVAKYFKEKFKKLTGKTKDEEEDDQSHRLRGNILRWAYAHTKFAGIGKENQKNEIDMSKEDVNFAFTLMRYSFKLLGLIKGGFIKYEDMEEIPTKTEINKYYLVKEAIKDLFEEYKNKIPYDKLLERVKKENEDMDEDALDKEIDILNKNGEVFIPSRGFIARI